MRPAVEPRPAITGCLSTSPHSAHTTTGGFVLVYAGRTSVTAQKPHVPRSTSAVPNIRYTPTSAFDTFPWPQRASRSANGLRAWPSSSSSSKRTLCHEHGFGLTRLYNALDDGAVAARRDAHVALDLAVVAAYGWSSAVLDDVRTRWIATG